MARQVGTIKVWLSGAPPTKAVVMATVAVSMVRVASKSRWSTRKSDPFGGQGDAATPNLLHPNGLGWCG